MKIGAVVAAALAGAIALSGCGGDSTDQKTSSSSAAASSSTAAPSGSSGTTATSPTSQADWDGQPPAAGTKIDGPVFATVVRAAIIKGRSYHMTVSSTSGQTGQANAVESQDDTDIDLKTGGQQVLFVAGDAYIHRPELDAKKPWIKVPKNSTEDSAKSTYAQLTTGGSERGARSMVSAELVDKQQVSFVGKEGGGAHYQLAIPGTDFLDQTLVRLRRMTTAMKSSASEIATIEAPIKAARAKVGSAPVLIEYWLDDQQRPVKVIEDYRKFDAAGVKLEGATGTKTSEFTKWGQQVAVTAPPAAQTKDLGPLGN